MKTHLAAALLLALVGCSTPPHALPASGESRTFTVAMPSDVVYRRVVEGARTCYARFAIDADYFPDNRSARVSMSVKSDLNVASLFMAQLTPADGSTKVQVFYLKGNPAFADAVAQWISGNYADCPFA